MCMAEKGEDDFEDDFSEGDDDNKSGSEEEW